MEKQYHSFNNLKVWQICHRLAIKIYIVTQTFPETEKFGLISQIRRAATSVTANIAEGYGRYHFKDRIKFYYQARGSITEVQNFLFISNDLGLVASDEQESLIEEYNRALRMLNGLINSIKQNS